MEPSHAERMNNVADHVEVLRILLDRRAPDGITQRVYRARIIVNDVFRVLTILQNLPGHQGRPDGSIRLYVASIHSDAEPLATLTGQYAIDEVVAFLGLDMIEAKHLYWLDETRYSSDRVVVGDIVRNAVLPG